jgi:hypothetical protein
MLNPSGRQFEMVPWWRSPVYPPAKPSAVQPSGAKPSGLKVDLKLESISWIMDHI